MPGYRCHRCGQFHEGPPFSYEFEAPDLWAQLSETKRQRSELTSEICVIEDRYFFIKGNLWIPVRDADEEFNWTVWSSLSRENFERSVELWDFAGREKEPLYFGWLSNQIPIYPDTFNLKVNVHTLAVGERPAIELEPTEHPLALEQRGGIALARVQEIAEIVLHSPEPHDGLIESE